MNPLLPKDFYALVSRTIDTMSDKKKTGLVLSYRTALIALVTVVAVNTTWIAKSISVLHRLPDLIDTIDTHTKEIEANRKSVEELREAMKRNKLVDFGDGQREHATLVFLP